MGHERKDPTYLNHHVVIEVPELYSSPSAEEQRSITMTTHTLHRVTISLPLATATEYIKYHPHNVMRDALSLVSCSHIPFHYVLIAGAGIDHLIATSPVNTRHGVRMGRTLHEKKAKCWWLYTNSPECHIIPVLPLSLPLSGSIWSPLRPRPPPAGYFQH